MTSNVGWAKGKCPRCGQTLQAPRPADIMLCDCHRHCPLCGALMDHFDCDLAPKTYNISGQQLWTVETLYVCRNHTPPHYSDEQPVEVLLS